MEEPNKGDEVVLNIESLSGDGKTVARQDGMVFFVEGAVPGDTVRARVFKLKKNFGEARALEVLTPSLLRTEPRCKHFGICGGCKWQNLSYDAQLRFKRQHVVDAFVRIGGFENPDVQPVIGADDPYFYRNKMEFTFSNSRWLTEEEMLRKDEIKQEVALGLHVPQRWDKLVNVEECWLQSELSAAIVNAVREIARGWNLSVYSTETHEGYLRHLIIREGKRTGEVMVNLVTTNDWPEAMQNLTKLLLKHYPEITTIVNNITTRKAMVAFGEQEKVYHGPGYIREQLGNRTFHISANSFFQTNTLQAERLYNIAKQFAQLTPKDVVYDLYSGTGTIAIFLSDAVERVIGIEVVESSIRDAERNAELNRISNCYFLQGDLKDRLTKDIDWLHEHPKPTVVVADPPRNGMHEKVVERIIALSPGRIVYVSCNPSTQARDAKLLSKGGYRLQIIQPVDMFPHTDHIESVALLTR
ncbi:MAG: 23S rRNA (uracil(1939)-C(5))-methyltransferase RlmD [Ignavibacteriae bacterium]|nr:23S rRNA (uracil(1939)-C(5))-methyltransferase RlmD [Ignavibacteria bacterium]MBI3364047.1 23S rRNA (uracil(1939)-C(5))-methyltransferase RlmD [Ignavibacteriota bacterium]